MTTKRRRAPTLRSLARRLRTLFTSRAHVAAARHADAFLKAAKDAGYPVKETGNVPWEVYSGMLIIGYANSVTNESEHEVVPFSFFSSPNEPTDAQRRADADAAAWDALREWFTEEGAARFVLSAEWKANIRIAWDPDAPMSWRDDGVLIASGDSDLSAAMIGQKPTSGTARRAARGQRPRGGPGWRITRRSTMRGERIRRRNAPGTKDAGGELEDYL